MKCFYQYLVYDQHGAYGSGGWSRTAKHRPLPRTAEGWDNLPKKQELLILNRRTLTLNGVVKKKFNIIYADGSKRIDYPDIVPDWWKDPILVAEQFAQHNQPAPDGAQTKGHCISMNQPTHNTPDTTWQQAKRDAEKRVAMLPLPPGQLDGLSIVLTDYEDEVTYKFLCGLNNTWALDYHRVVNQAVRRILKKRGATINVFTIRMADYMKWLSDTNQDNTPANRAQFANLHKQ